MRACGNSGAAWVIPEHGDAAAAAPASGKIWRRIGALSLLCRIAARKRQRSDIAAKGRQCASISCRWLAAGELASTTSPRRPSVASSGSATPPPTVLVLALLRSVPMVNSDYTIGTDEVPSKARFVQTWVPRGSASSFATGELLRATRLVLRQATLAPHPLRNKCSPAQGSTGGAGTA